MCVCVCVCDEDDRGPHSLCRMRCLQNTFLTRTETRARLPCADGSASDLTFICSICGDKAASLTEFLISDSKRHLLSTAFISYVHGRVHAPLCLYERTTPLPHVCLRLHKKCDFTPLPQCVAAYKSMRPFTYFFFFSRAPVTVRAHR